MTVTQKAFKQASWLAFFKLITQIFSWSSTIIVARLLTSYDYGLMDKATIFTGYAAIFSELGLGAAIIQRSKITQEHLSSIFWFTVIISFFFGVCCLFISYPTSIVFNEPNVVPLTQAVAIIFILNGISIVPFNLIKKNIEFKTIGAIEMIASFISCIIMILIASHDGGAWTLLIGSISRSLVRLVLTLYLQKWWPKWYFHFEDVKDYLAFGAMIAIGRTFHYLFGAADRFFAGMVWTSAELGLYTFSFLLASIPTEKIISLIMQVAFSAFSKLQDNKSEFNSFYLNLTKMVAIIVLPLFIGAYLVGYEIISVFLDEKWIPIVLLFKMLCISQIFATITAVNEHVHVAQNRPRWGITYYGLCAIFMSISFFIVVRYGLNYMAIPWLTTYPLISMAFSYLTLKKLGITIKSCLRKLSLPVFATIFMAIIILTCTEAIKKIIGIELTSWQLLSIKVLLGATSYIAFLYFFDRDYLKKVFLLLVKR